MCWFFKRNFQLEGENETNDALKLFLGNTSKNTCMQHSTNDPPAPPGGSLLASPITASMHGHSTDSTMHAALNTMTNLFAVCPKIMILFV